MKLVCETERLIIRFFNLDDAEFILQQLNEKSFIDYIGDKNVRSITDAKNYLINGPIASYKTLGFGLNLIVLKSTGTPIGMCGLLKRAELDSPDLGYAFLPEFCKKGYALEASSAILTDGIKNHALKKILAVTLANNKNSISLLNKLGFNYTKQIQLYGSQNKVYEYVT